MKIIKIGAIWCPVCIVLKNNLMEFQKQNPDLRVEYIDIDDNPEVKQKYEIDDVPVIVVLDDTNNVVTKFQGEDALNNLLKFIEK
ncbi:MAG: thioredoxin family protein [Candidatus Falkowbacteria bacterium]